MYIPSQLLDATMPVDSNNQTKLLDFFALAAPPVPKWFKPDIGPKPIRPDCPYSQEDKKFIEAHFDDGNDIWVGEGALFEKKKAILAPIVEKYSIALATWEARLHSHDRELAEQTLFQWPYFYAYQMLEQRADITTDHETQEPK